MAVSTDRRGIDRKRWRVTRRAVLERDGYRCRKCGRPGRLEVDHIRSVKSGGAALDPNNLQTLCRSCHIGKTRDENLARQARLTPQRSAWRQLVDEMMTNGRQIPGKFSWQFCYMEPSCTSST